MAERYAKDTKCTVIPALRYKDAHAAIDWLVKALGFTAKAVYDGPDGADGAKTVAHAELTFGNGMIMLGSASNAKAENWVQPDETGGRTMQTPYLVVADAAAVYESAKAAGAEFTMELQEMDYGGKAFGCKDPEGHAWSIGEYDPWAPA